MKLLSSQILCEIKPSNLVLWILEIQIDSSTFGLSMKNNPIIVWKALEAPVTTVNHFSCTQICFKHPVVNLHLDKESKEQPFEAKFV